MSSNANHVWFDLVTPDPAAGATFYRELIGYGSETWNAGDEPYEMLTVGGKGIGGVMRGEAAHWLGYVGVDDVDASVARLEALGGTRVMGPVEVPGAGRFVMARDPQGAMFAVFQSTNPSEAPSEKPRPGDVTWCELMTSDMESALDFYGELFGWRRTEAMEMEQGAKYQMFGTERTLGGAMNSTATPPAWLYYLHVSDVDACCAKAQALGAKLLNGPMSVPGGDQVAQLLDPQGAAFAIHGPGPA